MDGTGHVSGTKKHKHAKELIDRYQEIHGDRGLETEQLIRDNGRLIRPDVIDYKNKMIYDYKFGFPNQNPAQLNMTNQRQKYRFILQMPSEVIKPGNPLRPRLEIPILKFSF